ncbi:hypothetical protein BSKO_03739 [Bryopsis sp. KO-2023]|nr:hypothetical protein BSKO_03739 [Bryopsis sp. KO-2023]
MSDSKKKVVIVGGGFAGRTARRLLSKTFDVTLIDAKGYFEYVPSSLRSLVEPSHARTIVTPHPADVLVGKVVKITQGKVELSSGMEVSFDYCLICTGSSYTPPIKSDAVLESSVGERCEEYDAAHQTLKQAKRVIIVGGGTVGVELAAEIVGTWGSRKEVTLISSIDRLLARMPVKAGLFAAEWLQSKSVRLILEERIDDWSASSPSGAPVCLTTDQGRTVEGDLLYKCIGFTPCSEFLDLEDGAKMESVEFGKGNKPAPIPVRQTLQVTGWDNVFSVGDCSNTPEEKTALAADLAARVACKNIVCLSQGAADLLKFPEAICHGSAVPEIVDVSLYKYNGIVQFKQYILTGIIAGIMKWSIEFIQLCLAREWVLLVFGWEICEKIMVYLLKFL